MLKKLVTRFGGKTAARTAGTLAGALTLLMTCAVATGHHSFAVFFDTDGKLTKVSGVVKEFRFTNPHGIVTLGVRQGGREILWRAETNSPSILRRRGWTQDSIHVGETITIEGWPARDGSKYMRLRAATRADGQAIGTQPTPVKE
jgi:hypothetical protein